MDNSWASIINDRLITLNNTIQQLIGTIEVSIMHMERFEKTREELAK